MRERSTRPHRLVPVLVLGLFALSCTRKHYREHADDDTYRTLHGATRQTPWQIDPSFTIDTDTRSRLHDPSDPDDPTLPNPGPHLYEYEFPSLLAPPDRRSARGAAKNTDGDRSSLGLPIQPIPKSYWEDVPERCLARMLEFSSVQKEYRDEYEAEPPAELIDSSRRLSFDEIIELALLNSREYQARKEALYTAALGVTLERFDYSLQFSPSGNGVDLDYTHDRRDGDTVQSAGVGPSIAMERMLATGGTILGRFANNIVLTFDGVEGWAKDISSELLVSLDQSLFQRDIRLESLTQAERSMVYAARDFARFRRQFFVDLASRYYNILRTYRSIEIESQNYFSLVRTYEQARAEESLGVKNAPNPVAVDQFEQSMLSGRSSLVSTWNQLESSLDDLKLSIGVPTETPINIGLGELDELTLRDKVEVAAERVRRWRGLVVTRRNRPNPERGDVLNGGIFLIERILDWIRLRAQLGASTPPTDELEELLLRFRTDAARVEVERNEAILALANDPNAGSPIVLRYGRTTTLVSVSLSLAGNQAKLARGLKKDPAPIDEAEKRIEDIQKRLTEQLDRLDEALQEDDGEQLDTLVNDANALLEEARKLVADLDTILALDPEPEEEAARVARTLEQTDSLVARTDKLIEGAKLGLPELGIAEDDAMRTALIQRFDLMNARGQLADTWRGIKHAADELRAIVNLGASYSIGTRDNKPFKFTEDESRGQATLSVDLPLNRRDKRNEYRRALIGYQSERRDLMELEDSIKRDVRNSMRDLDERRIQYPISVTQAALAAEQVISVRLQLALGVEGVRGTDLLDAQEASRRALISVANERIGYIVDRAQLVLDLERMDLDESGMWKPISDPSYRPTPDLAYPQNAGPAYGDLPSFLLLSKEIRRLLDHPLPGTETVPAAQPDSGADSEAESEPESGSETETAKESDSERAGVSNRAIGS